MKNGRLSARLHRLLNNLLQLALLCGAVAWFESVNGQPTARMGISPDRYEVTFDERGGATQSLMIQNLSEEPLTVTLSVSHWDLDENNQLRIIPPTETSLDQWIVINPLRVTVPPGSPQTVRWAIMPRLKPLGGEYRAMLFIEEDLPPEQQPENTRVRMKMRYGLPIYAQVGERIQSAEFNGLNIDRDNNRIFLDITNTGNSHSRLTGNFGVWPAATFPGTEEALELLRDLEGRELPGKDFEVGSLKDSVVLPDSRRSIPVDVVLENPGDYVVQLNGRIADLEITDAITLIKPDT